jgi:hypothetical protein
VSGKNLFNLNPISFPYTYNEIAVSNNNGVIILDGTVTGAEFLFPDGDNLNQTIYKYLKPSTTYVFSTGYSDKNMSLQVFYRETDGTPWKKLAETYHQENITFTTPASYAVIWIRVRFTVSAVLNNARLYPMIRLATEQDATYELYNPNSQTIQVSWQTEAGEVFGGYIDLVSGVLTATHGYIDLGTLTWEYDSGNNSRMMALLTGIKNIPNTEVPNMICSCYEPKSLNDVYDHVADGIIGVHNSNSNIWVYDSRYTDATQFKAAMDGVQLVYKLATPTTIQLTPTQVKSLLGSNNLWADTGEIIDCEYKRDATAIINSLIARIEALENQ